MVSYQSNFIQIQCLLNKWLYVLVRDFVVEVIRPLDSKAKRNLCSESYKQIKS